jgi:hypothetical protein
MLSLFFRSVIMTGYDTRMLVTPVTLADTSVFR